MSSVLTPGIEGEPEALTCLLQGAGATCPSPLLQGRLCGSLSRRHRLQGGQMPIALLPWSALLVRWSSYSDLTKFLFVVGIFVGVKTDGPSDDLRRRRRTVYWNAGTTWLVLCGWSATSECGVHVQPWRRAGCGRVCSSHQGHRTNIGCQVFSFVLTATILAFSSLIFCVILFYFRVLCRFFSGPVDTPRGGAEFYF